MNRKIAKFEVSGCLIVDAFAMPEDAVIYNIVRHPWRPDIFTFYVEHPDLPELIEGADPVEIHPILSRDEEALPRAWNAFDWGI